MPITPAITIRTDSSGFTPFTVHVDCLDSDLTDINIADCTVIWDFGDPNPPLNSNYDTNDRISNFPTSSTIAFGGTGVNYSTFGNYKNKTRFSDPRLDTETDNTGYTNRSIILNNKQVGFSAAYTYFHNNTVGNQIGKTGTFTITLTIIYNRVSYTTNATIDVTNGIFYNTWTNTTLPTGSNDWVNLKVNSTFINAGQNDASLTSCSQFATLERAFQWIDNKRPSGKAKIVFYNQTGEINPIISNPISISKNNIIISKADLNTTFSISNDDGITANSIFTITGGAKNIYIEDLTFKSNTNSALFNPYTNNITLFNIFNGSNFTLYNCNIYGFNKSIFSNSGKASNIFVCDNRINNAGAFSSSASNNGQNKGSFIYITGGSNIVIYGNSKEPVSTIAESITDPTQNIIDINSCTATNIAFNSIIYNGSKGNANAQNNITTVSGNIISGEPISVIGNAVNSSVKVYTITGGYMQYSTYSTYTLLPVSLTGATATSLVAGQTGYWFSNNTTTASSFTTRIGSYTGNGATGYVSLIDYSGTFANGITGYLSSSSTGSSRFLITRGITAETYSGFPRLTNIRGMSSGAILNTTSDPIIIPRSNIININKSSWNTVFANKLIKGTNKLSNINISRIDSNEILGANGGLAYTENSIGYFTEKLGALSISDSLQSEICNNVITIDQYSNYHSPAVAFSSPAGISFSQNKLTNNTIRSLSFLSLKTGLININSNFIFSEKIECRNNLFLDHPLTQVNLLYNSDISSLGLSASNNEYPDRRNSLSFYRINGITGTYTSWNLGVESTSHRTNTLLTDFNNIFGYSPPEGSYNNIEKIIDFNTNLYPESYYDYKFDVRPLAYSKGSSEHYHSNDGLTSAFIFNYGLTTGIAGSNRFSGLTSYNFSISIQDPTYNVKSATGSTEYSYIIGRANLSTNNLSYFTGITGNGIYIRTDISAVTGNDQVDIYITYTNDGPTGQGTSLTSQELGNIQLEHLFVGGPFQYLNDQQSSSVVTFDQTRFYGLNTTNSFLIWPQTKYSPVSMFRNSRYATGVSVCYDGITSQKQIQEFYTGKARPSWDNEIETYRLSYNFVNQSGLADKKYLLQGQSLTACVSIKSSRNPTKWVKTLSPYKTYFQNTYGNVTYAKDPRPISYYPLSTWGSSGIRPAGYGVTFGHPTALDPTGLSGWGKVADFIDIIKTQGWTRHMYWAPAGTYLNAVELNYPQISVSPLFRSGITPHSQYTNIQTTKNQLKDAFFKVPEASIYNGQGVFINGANPVWDVNAGYGITIDMGNTGYYQKIYDEYDPQVNYFGTKTLVFEVANACDVQKHFEVTDNLKSRYGDVDFMVELSLSDIYVREAKNYLSTVSQPFGMAGPHYLSDYITPGAEHIYAILYTAENNTDFNLNEVGLHFLRKTAELGQNGALYGSNQYSLYRDGINYFKSIDRRFDMDDIPLNYGPTNSPPPTPTILNYGFRNYPRHSEFNIPEKYVALQWQSLTASVPDFSHYVVYKAPIINGVSVTGTTFDDVRYTKNNFFYDPKTVVGTSYYYKISSVDVFGNESTASNIIGITFANESGVVTPTNITGSIVNSNINISWT